MSSSFKVGNLCLTVNAIRPEHNGLLVVVMVVNPAMRAGGDELTPYLIRRIDGMWFRCTNNQQNGTRSWSKCAQVWAPAYKLRPIEGDGQDERDCLYVPLEAHA